MIFIYDRTIEDVMRAIELIGKINSKGYDSLTSDEKAEWLAGLKGCYNASDLERIDTNCIVLAENLKVNGYTAIITPFQGWTKDKIPTVADMSRIQANVAAIRAAISVPANTPSVPGSLEVMDIGKANNLELILYNVSRVLASVTYSMKRVNTIYVNGGMLL